MALGDEKLFSTGSKDSLSKAIITRL